MLDFNRLDQAAVRAYARPDKYGPISEKLIRALYEDLLVAGDAAIDVGVNYGIHLFEMARCVGEKGLVIGIEANVERYGALLKRIAHDNLTNISLLNVAAADSEGFCDFFVNRSYSGWSSRNEHHRRTEEDVIEKVRAYAVELSRVIPVRINPRFIKIDIEGGEFPALLGMRQLMLRAQPIVVFEGALTKSAEQFGFPRGAVPEFFNRLKYVAADLFGELIDPADWRPGAAWNFVAFRSAAGESERVATALTNAWIKVLRDEKERAASGSSAPHP